MYFIVLTWRDNETETKANKDSINFIFSDVENPREIMSI